MTPTTRCRCGTPTKDHTYVCHNCADRLARALGDIPALTQELTTTAARQHGIDYRTNDTTPTTTTPSPVNWGAANAATRIRDLLQSWARLCQTDNVRHNHHHPGPPTNDDPTTLSRWLLWRVDGLTLHPAGPDAVTEITEAVEHAFTIIDRPPDRQYLGPCPQDACEGRMYARVHAVDAYCNTCRHSTAAETIRTVLLHELDDRLCTAAEIAHLSTYLGLKSTREQVRKRVEHWARKGRITSEAAISDAAVYRFGIVWRLLVDHETKRTG